MWLGDTALRGHLPPVLRGNRAFKPLRFGKKVGRKAICFLAIFIKPMMAKSMFGRTILGQSTLGRCWCFFQITTSKQLCVQDFTNRKRVVVVVSPPWLISNFCQQLGIKHALFNSFAWTTKNERQKSIIVCRCTCRSTMKCASVGQHAPRK